MTLLNSLNALFHGTDADEQRLAPLPREAERHTILIIDDNKEFLDSCTGILRDAGYTVLKSSAGTKGLNMLRYAPKEISAILLDFDMPQLDGSGTLKYIRQIAPDARVAGITGVDPNILPSSYRQGTRAVLSKPFNSEQLLEFVRELVAPPPPVVPAIE